MARRSPGGYTQRPVQSTDDWGERAGLGGWIDQWETRNEFNAVNRGTKEDSLQCQYGWLTLASIAAIGCGTKPPVQAARDSASGMMEMSSRSQGMVGPMRAYLDSVTTMSPDQMPAMMATHQGRVSAMLDALGMDMQKMPMAAGSAWSRLADSVRQDLAQMPGMSGSALGDRMRAHADRMRRLMADVK